LKVVCLPHNLRIVDYVVGLPGSVHDARAFEESPIMKDPNRFFSGNEWMWADSAYGCTISCVPPFKKPRGGSLTRQQKKFNYFLSKVCPNEFSLVFVTK
jgi:hypothetical protein